MSDDDKKLLNDSQKEQFKSLEEEAKHIPSATGYTIAQESEWAAEIIWQTSSNQMIEFCNTDGSLTENGGLTPPIYTGNQTLKFKPKKTQMEVY